MLAAEAPFRLFMDADGSTGIQELEKLLPLAREHDVVIGSRRSEGSSISVRQSHMREFLGATLFRNISGALLGLPWQDTQNGFKLFSARAADELFSELQTTGWAFDLEILLRANALGLSVAEVGIEWRNDPRSKMTLPHMVRMLVDVWRLREFRVDR
jgi:dolichyl-phosphate beta-glucosyltransferase